MVPNSMLYSTFKKCYLQNVLVIVYFFFLFNLQADKKKKFTDGLLHIFADQQRLQKCGEREREGGVKKRTV